MPSRDPVKRREQQRLRRERAAEASPSAEGAAASPAEASPSTQPTPHPDVQPSAEQTAPEGTSSLDAEQTRATHALMNPDSAVEPADEAHTQVVTAEQCLSDAEPLAQRITAWLATEVSARNLRAIAARLYQQRCGGSFSQLQQTFRLNGSNAFSRPTFNRFRDLLAQLDAPEGSFAMLLARYKPLQ
jgi:hypothetical protein